MNSTRFAGTRFAGIALRSPPAGCTGFASRKFGVRPSGATVHPAVRDRGMYAMHGTAGAHGLIDCVST